VEEECVCCIKPATGEYMGHPCCMSYECIQEIHVTEEESEKLARRQFGCWLRRVMRMSNQDIRKKLNGKRKS
jgi:hypothetical protein